jgi:hypothetical protein
VREPGHTINRISKAAKVVRDMALPYLHARECVPKMLSRKVRQVCAFTRCQPQLRKYDRFTGFQIPLISGRADVPKFRTHATRSRGFSGINQ